MKIYLKHNRNCEIVLRAVHKNNRKQTKLCDCDPKHWNESAQMITGDHPQFEKVYPYLQEIIKRSREPQLKLEKDLDKVIHYVLNGVNTDPDFLEFIDEYLQSRKQVANELENRKNLTERNREMGHIKHYNTVFEKLKDYYSYINYSQIDSWWCQQLQQKLHEDVYISDATANSYISRVKSLYSKMILKYRLPDAAGFNAVPKLRVSQRSYEARKKRLDDASMMTLINADLSGNQERARDIFVALFDLCGCDLTDLYFLERKQLHRGRIFFERSKVRGSSMDLMVSDRMNELIEKYAVNGDKYLFPWRKDLKGYHTFRDNARRDLRRAAAKLDIKDITGGEITMKCARHTFASRSKEMGVDGDLLRELMGHRRNDIDNYYKEAYPEKVRDQAHSRVISF